MNRLLKMSLSFVMAIMTMTIMAQDTAKVLKVGDNARMFKLKNAKGEEVSLEKLLQKGPVVLTWYRGGWCPYCNIALKTLTDRVSEMKEAGATLVALSPELPDRTAETVKKEKLAFEVVTDLNNQVAKAYGISFKLDTQTATRYESGFGLSKYNGNQDAELPIPATYIINKSGVIEYSYVNPDYKERAKPQLIIDKLKEMKVKSNENKLVVVWSSDDPMVAKRVAFMYSGAAQKAKWFDEVTLVIWGPSAKLIAENKELQTQLEAMKKDGVIVKACIACAQAYGVADKMKDLGYDVIPMGVPLTNYLKDGYKVLTF